MVHASSWCGVGVVLLALFLGGCNSDEIGKGFPTGSGGSAGGRGGGGGTTGAGGAGGATCSPSCGSSEYCALSTCGTGVGTCVTRPVDCIAQTEDIVCGCNGQLYRSPCEAEGAGVSISTVGGCEPPTGKFVCGTIFCAHGTQYCEKQVRGTGSQYLCRDLPAGCGATPACACIASVSQCDCAVAANGELMTMCVLPP